MKSYLKLRVIKDTYVDDLSELISPSQAFNEYSEFIQFKV